MNSDFKDLLRIFAEEGVEYLTVGAYAVIHYTQPRYTKDIDLWIKPSVENAERVARAFHRFGLPLVEVTQQDFEQEGLQYAIGMPPCQIDFLTSLPGAPSFDEAWCRRSSAEEDNIPIHFLGKSDLVSAKKTAARPQDLADLDELERAGG
ncbi:hypothetical protein [Haloferula rosea]|uniref:Nucleotidyltransferase family protein n=1 Tax=Haloferula rosea TaxID=490093 RepID=A0A934RF41_9BACT|nr:hypothetical protein [Haloferula rosea]MBK1828478.1 hypothetical protein [Haloferula rosea]